MINKGTRVNTDSALEKTQTDHITSEKSCEKELEDLRAELEGIKEIKRPERQFRYRRILVHAVIFGFIGLVVGACAALYWHLLRYTTEGKIHSGKELERLGKLKVIAAFELAFNEKKQQNKIDQFLFSRADIQQDSEQVIRMAALKLETLVEKDNTVLLTGNVSLEQLETLKQSIEKYTKAVRLVCGTEPEKNPDTYDALRKADQTVLVEEKNVGTYEQLAVLRGIADEVKTTVIGCIWI